MKVSEPAPDNMSRGASYSAISNQLLARYSADETSQVLQTRVGCHDWRRNVESRIANVEGMLE